MKLTNKKAFDLMIKYRKLIRRLRKAYWPEELPASAIRHCWDKDHPEFKYSIVNMTRCWNTLNKVQQNKIKDL